MAFRFLSRTSKRDRFADDDSMSVDPRVPAVGLSNFRGTLQKGDVVTVAIESTRPIVADFDVYSPYLGGDGYKGDGSLPCAGRYYPSEIHFFRLVEVPSAMSRYVCVEPLFLTNEKGVVHQTVDEHFNRDIAIPLDACEAELVFHDLVNNNAPQAWNADSADIKKRLTARHLPTRWFMPRHRNRRTLVEAVLAGQQLRDRTHVIMTTTETDDRLVDSERSTPDVQKAALKQSLRRVLYYVDYRETFELDPSEDQLQEYVNFIHSHQRELVHTLNLDEAAGELEALLDWTGTIERIRRYIEGDHLELMRDVFGREHPCVTCTCAMSLYRPASVGPSQIPFHVTRLKRKHILSVLRTDPVCTQLLPPFVCDWSGEPLDDSILTMLSSGNVVRTTLSSGDPHFTRTYCRLLQRLGPEHFLALLEGFYMSGLENVMVVLSTRSICEVPLRWSGNHDLYRRYRQFLRKARREQQGGVTITTPRQDHVHENESDAGGDNSEAEEDDVLDAGMDVPAREDAGSRIPLTFDPLLSLWGPSHPSESS